MNWDEFHLKIEENGISNTIKDNNMKNLLLFEQVNNPSRLNESINQYISKNNINTDNDSEIKDIEYYLLKYN